MTEEQIKFLEVIYDKDKTARELCEILNLDVPKCDLDCDNVLSKYIKCNKSGCCNKLSDEFKNLVKSSSILNQNVYSITDAGKQFVIEHQSKANRDAGFLNNTEIVYLLSVYEEEWRYRDNAWFSRTIKMFLISMIIISFPFVYINFIKKLPDINKLLFPISGIVVSTLFLFVSLMHAKRLSKIGDTIYKLNTCLKEVYQMERIDDRKINKFYKTRISYFFSVSIYILEIVLAAVVIFIIHNVN